MCYNYWRWPRINRFFMIYRINYTPCLAGAAGVIALPMAKLVATHGI